MLQEPALPNTDEIFLLFEISAGFLTKSSDPAPFLDWIANSGPVLAPTIASGIEGPPEQAFRAMGVSIYNAMPLPANDFRREPLPRPGRNDPCYCGSGEKFKHCCQSLQSLPDLSDYNMLRHILDNLSLKAFATLPGTRVDVFMLADTAGQWRDEGELNRAVKLLEPWFAGDAKLTGKLEPLFDELMDIYLELDKPRKRTRLLEKIIARGSSELRSTALQRKATILADQDDIEGAWQAFGQAQRENPGDISLSILELTLLITQGEFDKAKERARFWLARARRDRHANPDIIELLREAAEDPVAVFSDMTRTNDPELDQLMRLVAEAPPEQAHYGIEVHDIGAMLVPDKQLAALEENWAKVFHQCKPSLTHIGHDNEEVWSNAPQWLDFLVRRPLAWHSFGVLDDLVMAAGLVPVIAIEQVLLEPLLQRAEELLALNLKAATAQEKPVNELPWGFPENRCALRLLAHRAYRTMDAVNTAGGAVSVESAERLLLLNPMDNHGVRFELSRCYLENGEERKVVELAARFPDDLCTTSLNHILALYRLGLQGKALQALQSAADDHAQAIKMLLVANPRQPKLSEYGITLGGKDEAWLYRQGHLHLWQRDGALEWLRKAWRAVPKARRR